MKRIICNKKSTHPSINVQVDGEIITNQQTVAKEFNNFFINVGPNLSSNIPKTNKIFTDYLKQPTKNSMFLTPTNPTEIYNTINNLNSSKAMDIYDIPVKLLKLGNDFISVQLANIFNHSFDNGIFPDKLKCAYVIPIHKADSKLDINKYRPISILPAISKILEKIMANRLLAFLDKNNTIFEHQFGFQTGK